jgi:hypothetical protein
MRAWDELEHGNLPEEGVPTANIRRKKFYRQMAITMKGGAMGEGICIQHPKCVMNRIHMIFLDPDGNYMGHKND